VARLFVEQLCALDFARLDPEHGLLGDTWILDVELEGSLDHQGMVLDFGRVKPTIKSVADATVDHRLLVPVDAPGLRMEQSGGEVRLWFDFTGGSIFHRSPAQALCLLDSPVVTTDVVADHLVQAAMRSLPATVTQIRLGLREENIAGPWYRYAHGLRQHEGNCQRIAHGHRSRVEIFRDGRRCEATERWLADRWRDIYLGCREDLHETVEAETGLVYRFSYRAPQGEFELLIAADRCELLETESTVERIADHVLGLLKAREPGVRFTVRAYEGLNKGAIAEG
jgi:6-pyruvoyl-tetrahydropterin synthase